MSNNNNRNSVDKFSASTNQFSKNKLNIEKLGSNTNLIG